MNVSIVTLRYFASTVRCGSFAAAARELYVDATTVSKAVSLLEREVGVALFVRNGKSVEPTPYGMTFYEMVLSIMADMQELEDLMHSFGKEVGKSGKITVAIATSPYRGTVLDKAVIDAFRDAYPQIRLDVFRFSNTSSVHAVEEGSVDAAVVAGIDVNSSVKLARIGRVNAVVVCNDHVGRLENEGIAIEEIAGKRIAALDDADWLYKMFSDMCAEHGFEPCWEDVPPTEAGYRDFISSGGVVVGIKSGLEPLYSGFQTKLLRPEWRTTSPVFYINQKHPKNSLVEVVKVYLRKALSNEGRAH